MPAYEPVIGLEVHAQLLTATKVFCGCPTSFGAPPNANVCPVCLGLPGALPVLNRQAVDLAVSAALALGCDIHERSIFARKNYFYPDLPKGYQISQYEQPLATGGGVTIRVNGDAQVRPPDAHSHGRGRGKVAARRLSGLGSQDLPRLQPQRRAADRDRQRAGHAIGRRSRDLLRNPPSTAGVAGRQRRQHGRGQPALRRERVGAAARARRPSAPRPRSRTSTRSGISRRRSPTRSAGTSTSSSTAAVSCRRRGCSTRRRDAPIRCAARKRRTTTDTFPSPTCRRWWWIASASTPFAPGCPNCRRRDASGWSPSTACPNTTPRFSRRRASSPTTSKRRRERRPIRKRRATGSWVRSFAS